MAPASEPLVLDLSATVAGRFASRLFALGGARVLRVSDAPVEHRGTDASFLACYLDGDTPAEQVPAGDGLEPWAAAADVVFTSFDAGFHHLDADERWVREQNADAVHVTTSSYGTTGPYAGWRGGPVADWAAGGYLHITGEPDREPLMGPLHLCGYVAGYTAAMAAEAGLVRSRRGGSGTHVDISTMEAMLACHQSTFERLAAGVGRYRTGRYAEVYPLTVLPCADGFISLGVVTDEEFSRLLIALDRIDLVTDPRFEDTPARVNHRDQLDAELGPILWASERDVLVDVLQAHDVAAAPVHSELDVLANPQLNARGYFRHTTCGDRSGRAPGDPVRVQDLVTTEASADANAPTLPEVPAQSDAVGPLDGLLVLDLTAFWAGPSASRNLADLGARVITVERPGGRLDIDIQHPDLEPETLVAGLFHVSMNRGKESIVLDLHSPEGQRVAAAVATRADVLVENFRPGVLGRFGLGPHELCAANPALVYVSLSGFGSEGPWAAWRSYGPMIEAASSIEHRTGYLDGAPLRLGHTLPDGVGGLVGSVAALRGLRRRADTGRGGWYDISQLEAYVAMGGEEVVAASVRGECQPRRGNRDPDALYQGVLRCRGDDEWVAVRIVARSELAALEEAMHGLEGRATESSVAATFEAVERRLATIAASHSKEHMAATLQAQGLEAFPVLAPGDLVTDAHLRERSFFAPLPFSGGTAMLAGSPLVAHPSMATVPMSAPRVDEHQGPLT